MTFKNKNNLNLYINMYLMYIQVRIHIIISYKIHNLEIILNQKLYHLCICIYFNKK